MNGLARMWEHEHRGEQVPDADRLLTWAEERIAAYERQRAQIYALPLSGLGMPYVDGEYTNGDRLLWLGEQLDRLRQAVAEQERALVRFYCGLCDMPLANAAAVCLRCCGAEAMPGRCGLELGHAGEHEPPAVASPLPAQDDTTLEDDGEELPDRPPGCDWCGGRGCDICCAPGYAGVEYDPW